VLRGGAYNNQDDNVRAAARNDNNPNNWNDNIGFRLAVSTFFTGTLCPCQNYPAAPGFRAEAKNGRVCSWPRQRSAHNASGLA